MSLARRRPSSKLLLLLLLAACALYPSRVAAQPQSAIQLWCGLPGHRTASACFGGYTPCQTEDNWWNTSGLCPIPGTGYPAYPYSYTAWDVCAGQQTQLVDSSNRSYGGIYVFRDYANIMHVTVALDGVDNGQWFLVPTQGTTGPPQTASLAIWDPTFNASAVPGQYGYQGQYTQQRVGRYACFTFTVNLTQICNPYTSYQGRSGSCICYDSGQPCASAKDLSDADYLYVGVVANLTFYSISTTSCGTTSNPPLVKLVSSQVAAFATGCTNTHPPSSPPPPPFPPPPNPFSPPPSPPFPSPPPSSPPTPLPPLPPKPPPPLPPSPPRPPTPDYPIAFSNITVTALRSLNQAQGCMMMLSQTYYYWMKLNTTRFDCNFNGGPTSLKLSLEFGDTNSSRLFNAAMDDPNIWNNLLATLSLGCGMQASFTTTEYDSSYSLCSSASQATNCRAVLGQYTCSPPPPPQSPPPSPLPPPSPRPPPPAPSPPPPPNPCTTFVNVSSPGAYFSSTQCAQLVTLINVLYNSGTSFVCLSTAGVPSMAVGATIASVAQATSFINQSKDAGKAGQIATQLQLACGSSILFDSTLCGGASSSYLWNAANWGITGTSPGLLCSPPPPSPPSRPQKPPLPPRPPSPPPSPSPPPPSPPPPGPPPSPPDTPFYPNPPYPPNTVVPAADPAAAQGQDGQATADSSARPPEPPALPAPAPSPPAQTRPPIPRRYQPPHPPPA